MSNHTHTIDLTQYTLFKALKKSECQLLVKHLRRREFKCNDVVIEQGKMGHALYLIESGAFSVNTFRPGSEFLELAIKKSGEFFGEITLLSDDEISASVICKKAGACYELSYKVMEMLKIYDPELANNIQYAVANHALFRIRKLIIDLQNSINTVSEKLAIKAALPSFRHNTQANHYPIALADLDYSLIENMPFFANRDQAALRFLIEHCEIAQYDKGYLLYAANKNSNDCAVLYEGAIQFSMPEGVDAIKKLGVVGPGKLVGFWPLADIHKNPVDVIVREKAEIIKIPMRLLETLKEKFPTLWYHFYEVAYREVVTFLQLITRQLIRINSEYHDIITR